MKVKSSMTVISQSKATMTLPITRVQFFTFSKKVKIKRERLSGASRCEFANRSPIL
jgi:hypothetical protein